MFFSTYRRGGESGCADGEGNSSLGIRYDQECLLSKSVIDISYDPESISGEIPKGERKGRQLRSAFSSQLMLLSLVCAVLRESGNKDSTITSAVKS